jgi:hypothetical protein
VPVALDVFDASGLEEIVREPTGLFVSQEPELVGEPVLLALTELAKDAETEYVGLAVHV